MVHLKKDNTGVTPKSTHIVLISIHDQRIYITCRYPKPNVIAIN